MAKMVLPRVHVMVLCDEIEPAEADVFDLRGVRTYLVAPSFPYTHAQLCVYLQVTGHEGMASGRVVAIRAETDDEVDSNAEEEVLLQGPLTFIQLPWRVVDCTFPTAGAILRSGPSSTGNSSANVPSSFYQGRGGPGINGQATG